MRTLVSLVVAFNLIAPGVQAGPKKAPAQPENAASKTDKAAIIQWAQETLADPYSMRSTGISDVTVVKGVSVICIEFNAKNNYGGYDGVQRFPFVVSPQGLLPGTWRVGKTDTSTCYDPTISMRPFPELASIK